MTQKLIVLDGLILIIFIIIAADILFIQQPSWQSSFPDMHEPPHLNLKPVALHGQDLSNLQRNRIKYIQYLENQKANSPEASVELNQKIENIKIFVDGQNKTISYFNQIGPLDLNIEKLVQMMQKIIVDMEFHMNKISLKKSETRNATNNNTNPLQGMVNKVFNNIADSADDLENSMAGNDFEKGMNETSNVKTVLTMNRENSHSMGISLTLNLDKTVLNLVDSQENKYSLTKAADITLHYTDDQLLKGLLVMVFSALFASYIFQLFGLPSFFGQLIVGAILGSSGLIGSIIPLDTISRGFGTIFIMFSLGLEFNFQKIKKVWFISVVTCLVIFMGTLFLCIIMGYMVNAQIKESVLVGSCISLSSTAVALSLVKEHEMNLPFVRYMIGVLIIQDVLLGLILGLIPALSSSMSQAPFTAISIIGSLALFVVISIILYVVFIKFLLNITVIRSHESYLAVSLGFCISLVLLAEWMDISSEFACFVAGVVIASNESHSEKTLELIGPLKIIFSSLFFTSIGLFIYPSFLLDELLILGPIALLVIILKLVIGYLILRSFKVRSFESLKISIGLSQVSEFSLLLSSRAKNVNIIGRETYFTLLGVTILSLLSTPILWYIVNRSSSQPQHYESQTSIVKSNTD